MGTEALLEAAPGTPAKEGADEPVIARFSRELRGAESPEMAQLHTLWLLQAVRDWYQGLSNEDQRICTGFARELGALQLMELHLPRRLSRSGNVISFG